MTQITVKKFKDACSDSNGVQARIAERMKVTRSAVSHFINRHPELKELVIEEMEILGDYAEDNVKADIRRGDSEMSKWYLLNSKVGKARGYGAKTEVEHIGQVGVIFEEVIKSSKEIKDGKKANSSK